jgi:hypothetical protein
MADQSLTHMFHAKITGSILSVLISSFCTQATPAPKTVQSPEDWAMPYVVMVLNYTALPTRTNETLCTSNLEGSFELKEPLEGKLQIKCNGLDRAEMQLGTNSGEMDVYRVRLFKLRGDLFAFLRPKSPSGFKSFVWTKRNIGIVVAIRPTKQEISVLRVGEPYATAHTQDFRTDAMCAAREKRVLDEKAFDASSPTYWCTYIQIPQSALPKALMILPTTPVTELVRVQ